MLYLTLFELNIGLERKNVTKKAFDKNWLTKFFLCLKVLYITIFSYRKIRDQRFAFVIRPCNVSEIVFQTIYS